MRTRRVYNSARIETMGDELGAVRGGDGGGVLGRTLCADISWVWHIPTICLIFSKAMRRVSRKQIVVNYYIKNAQHMAWRRRIGDCVYREWNGARDTAVTNHL